MTSEILLHIDGKEVRVPEGTSILDAARGAGITIPTLCHHEKLEAFGACRLCIVEVESGGRTSLVVSCVAPAEADAVVTTRSDKIDGFRKTLLELALSRAPHSPVLLEMGQEYGADRDRFQ